MLVTGLTQSPRSPDRWTIQLENGEPLPGNLDRIAEFGLFTGRELTDEELAALRDKCRRSRVRERALRLLGSRMLSRKELCDRLCSKGETPADAQETADWLESMGALNDAAYAAAIVRHYAGRGYGPARINNEWYRRGIPPELSRDALAQDRPAEDRLGQLAQRELARLPAEPEARAAALRKLRDKLLRRGFDPAAVRRALAQAEEDPWQEA